MDEITELRKRRLAELQARSAEQGEEAQLQSQITQLDAIVKAKLSREALARYSNIKVAHPELWLQSLVVIAQLIQSGRVAELSDADYKAILEKLQPKKRDIKIRKV